MFLLVVAAVLLPGTVLADGVTVYFQGKCTSCATKFLDQKELNTITHTRYVPYRYRSSIPHGTMGVFWDCERRTGYSEGIAIQYLPGAEEGVGGVHSSWGQSVEQRSDIFGPYATLPPDGAPYMKWDECVIPVPVTESQGVLRP